jgi:hypothetical protein
VTVIPRRHACEVISVGEFGERSKSSVSDDVPHRLEIGNVGHIREKTPKLIALRFWIRV